MSRANSVKLSNGLLAALWFALAASFLICWSSQSRAQEVSESNDDAYIEITDLLSDSSITTSLTSTVYLIEDDTFYHLKATLGREAGMRFAPPSPPGKLGSFVLLVLNRGILSAHIVPEAQGAKRILQVASPLGFVQYDTGSQHDFTLDSRIDGSLVITALIGSLEYGYVDVPEERRILLEGQQIILYPRGDQEKPESRELQPIELDAMSGQMLELLNDVEDNAPEETVTLSFNTVVSFDVEDIEPENTDTGVVSVMPVGSPVDRDVITVSEDDYSLFDVLIEYEGAQQGPQLKELWVGPIDVFSSGWGSRFMLPAEEYSGGALLAIRGVFADSMNVRNTEISIDGGVLWRPATGLDAFEFSFSPELTVTYPLHLRVTLESGASYEHYIGTISWKRYERPYLDMLQIGNREMPHVHGLTHETLHFTREDTIRGRMRISGSFRTERDNIQRVMLTLDGGARWLQADGAADFEYSFEPQEDIEYIVGIMSVLAGNVAFEEDFAWTLRFYYQTLRPETSLREAVETQMNAYRAEDVMGVFNHVSQNFVSDLHNIPDFFSLQSEVRRDFAHPESMYLPSQLQYRIQSLIVAGQNAYGTVILEWKNAMSHSYQVSALTYVFEDGRWKLTRIENSSPFGVYLQLNEPSELTLIADPQTITATEFAHCNIEAQALNAAGDPLSGVVLLFQATPSDAGALDSQTATTDAQGYASVTFRPSVAFEGREIVRITAATETLSTTTEVEILADSPPQPEFPD